MNRAENVFSRMSKGIYYNKNLKIYTKKYLEEIIIELGNLEEFEKCISLKKIIEERFRHEENYKDPIV